MDSQNRKNIRRIVVDESVSTAQWLRFQSYAKENTLSFGETYFIKERHPGIPDRLILRQLLDFSTVLLTADRPLHNQALELRLQSFHIGTEYITGLRLPGVHPRPLIGAAQRPFALKTDYQPTSPALRSALMPRAPTRLKKLTVKRRRIRNHFGGLDQLAQNAISVSYVARGSNTLIGVRLRVSAHSDLKALDASESYIEETVESGSRAQAAFCHALVVPIQLLLHQVSTVVYYDATRMKGPYDQPNGLLSEFFAELAACFPQLTFNAVTNGRHLERLHHKLKDLCSTPLSNEILPGTLHKMLQQTCWRTKAAADMPSP